jgi:hypothetical protein
MKKIVLGLLFAISMAIVALPVRVAAEDFENPKAGAVKWKVYDYNRITTHPARIADKIAGGIAFDLDTGHCIAGNVAPLVSRRSAR